MKEVVTVIKAIGQTSGYSDKLAILKNFEDTPGLKEILKFIYNPYCKTGISAAKLSKDLSVDAAISVIEWKDAIEYFTKHQTGSDADIAFAKHFIRYTEKTYGADAMRLACAIVTQDLKIGITATSLNKVYGKDFIPKTGCMLGTLFGDVPPSRIAWPCIVTEKLDGIRRVLVKQNGVCSFYSRSGHKDEGLIDILKEAKHLPDNFVYDGELLAAGIFKDCIAQRQATNSIANSKGTKTGLTFNVFDMIPVDDFYNGVCALTAKERKIRLGATLMDDSIQLLDENWPMLINAFGIYEDLQFIKAVPILGVVNNLDEVTPIVEKIWAAGGEGVMLNTVLGPYEIKRSKQLLKVKHTEEHILPIVNFIEGSGKYEDSLGALVVLYTDKQGRQSYLGVGSGLTDDQRREIWSNPELYLGLMVEIECFGESTNSAGSTSLNCPIFKRFVGDNE
jgi:DNA ligase-1